MSSLAAQTASNPSNASALDTDLRPAPLANQYLLVPAIWRKALLVSRLLIALICFRENYNNLGWGWYVEVDLALLFCGMAIVCIFWERAQRPPYALYALSMDTAFLLIFLWTQTFNASWLPALWFAYIISSAVLIHPWQSIPALSMVVGLGVVKNPHLSIAFAPVAALGAAAAVMRKQFEDRMFRLSHQSVMYRAEAQVAKEGERERIAADLHDGPLQAFVSVQMRMEVVRRMLLKNFDKGIGELEQLQALWKGQIDDVRLFIRSIRQQDEDAPTDLAIALSHLVDAFKKETNVDVEFGGEADLESLPAQVSLEILQLMREALHNIHKHAEAKYVKIEIQDKRKVLEISIRDNGKGFPFQGKFNQRDLEILRKGPASILRRVRNLDGTLSLQSSSTEGSQLDIRIPR